MRIQDAIRSNSLEDLRELIDGAQGNRAQLNAIDEQTGRTALHIASLVHQVMAMEMLLSAGANPNVGMWEHVDLFPKEPFPGVPADALVYGEITPDNERGCTPLHVVSENGDMVLLQLLIAHKADLNPRTAYGFTPLHLAAHMGHYEVVDALICHGANVQAETINGETPLHVAARGGSVQVVEKLLDSGADTAKKCVDGFTALDMALGWDNADLADLLRGRMNH